MRFQALLNLVTCSSRQRDFWIDKGTIDCSRGGVRPIHDGFFFPLAITMYNPAQGWIASQWVNKTILRSFKSRPWEMAMGKTGTFQHAIMCGPHVRGSGCSRSQSDGFQNAHLLINSWGGSSHFSSNLKPQWSWWGIWLKQLASETRPTSSKWSNHSSTSLHYRGAFPGDQGT